MSTCTPKPIRILILNAQAVMRAGLRLLLESRPGLAVVAEATNCSEAVAAAASEQPDIILLDPDSGDERAGLHFVPQLRTAALGARIIVLTGVRAPEAHRAAVHLGAIGVVLKEKAADVLFTAIEKVHAGEAWLDRALVADLLDELTYPHAARDTDPERAKIATLTTREREVIAIIGEGVKSKSIAERLSISNATVRHHLTSIFAKLGVADRLELVIYAYRYDLARLPR